MLGREHEADLEREARKRDLAAQFHSERPARKQRTLAHRGLWRLALRARLSLFLG
jgi:hypothetical protein